MTSASRPSNPNNCPTSRLHGRVPRDEQCDVPGCHDAGEFRAPARGSRRGGAGGGASSGGPGAWRWLCLDHVRQYNSSYDYFAGMSAEEILAAQSPTAGWTSEVRAFRAACSADLPPRWADFTDPADAMGARFRQRRADAGRPAAHPRFSTAEQRALAVLGLDAVTDRATLRQRYAQLLRRYHPDRNGGDRTHEKALQAVVEAYTALVKSGKFA